MKVASKFSIAVHTLLYIYKFDGETKTSSENISKSVGVNPVIIRQVLSDLKNAGIITVKFGTGGASLNKNLKDITLLDIYNAVIPKEEGLFSFHQNPEPKCPVGKNIHNVLDDKFLSVKDSFDSSLKEISLLDLAKRLDELTNKQH